MKSCAACQLAARKTKADKVPIKIVDRGSYFGDIVHADLCGEIQPNSSAGHKYILVLIDSLTRWVELIPMKTLTTKEMVAALLQVCCRIGIMNTLVTDNGTIFTSALANHVYAYLGIQIRHSTAYHPEGNSLCERVIGTVKRMLHHIIHDSGTDARRWHERLQLLAFAYRSIPHSTTGLSPARMVYGRDFRGPLAIVQDAMSGDKNNLPRPNQTVTEYLELLQKQLSDAADAARCRSEPIQQAYTKRYNRVARTKSFQVGDAVLYLMPDSTNALLSRWLGPGTVTAVISENSYRVSLPNGSIKTVHANHMRRFFARVQAAAVVFDEDETDFGEIFTYQPDVDDFEEKLAEMDLSNLSGSQKSQLHSLLQEFRHVFSDKPGSCKTAPHEVKVKDGFPPKAVRNYRIPERLVPEVQRQLDILLRDNKIQPSTSAFAHPLVCVAKKNNQVRVCTDLRYLNSGTIPDAYQMPDPDDLLTKIGRSRWITLLDLVAGYNQIPVKPEHTHYFAFYGPKQLLEWKVLPFGARNSGQCFQRVMDEVLRDHSYADAYIDDVAVYSDSWEDHLTHLRNVLQSFSDVGMTLRLDKAVFCKQSVSYLGHQAGGGKRSPLPERISAIQEIPEPSTKKQLRRFLGMANFYRIYISAFSEIVLPLTDLTKKSQSNVIKFNEKQRTSFIAIKKALCDATELYVPCVAKPYVLRTDASDSCAAACLAQVVDGLERPVAFMSKKFTATQTRYSVIEREALAVIMALKKWDYWLYAAAILLRCDHSPLQYVISGACNSSKLTRWALILSRYDITFKHIAGADNVAADFLSRY